jgi:hypothetical protein
MTPIAQADPFQVAGLDTLLLPRILTSSAVHSSASDIRRLFYHIWNSTAENLLLGYFTVSPALAREQLGLRNVV